jgi:O-antigen ligase
MASILRSAVPACLLVVFAWKAGNFSGAATREGAVIAQVLLLAALALACWSWRPRLPWSRRELVALGLLVSAVAFCCWRSPLPRAGQTALLLLPAFAILPRLMADLIRSRRELSLATAGIAATTMLIGLRAFFGLAFEKTPGASLPLGHHNLLAAFLILALPWCWASLVAIRGPGRWLAGGALAIGLAALLATGSLSGLVALAVAVLWVHGQRLRWLLAILPLAALFQLPRLIAIVQGNDLSTSARVGYALAAIDGWLARPWLGWGPGTTPWLLSRFLEPVLGVHPPDHVVADAHSLPLQLLFELGVVGAVAALAFCLLQWRLLSHARDPYADAARTGVLATAAMCFAGWPLAVTALPLTLAVVLGLGRAAAAVPAGAGLVAPQVAVPAKGLLRVAGLIWVGFALGILVPRNWAMGGWEQVATAPVDVQEQHLAWAAENDPSFPLYQLPVDMGELVPASGAAKPLSQVPSELPIEPEAAERVDARTRKMASAERALGAARAAGEVPTLWLLAGRLGAEAGAPWAREALVRSCERNPFGALAPFVLAVAEPPLGTDTEREGWMARALLAEPRLIAARAWRQHPERMAAALLRLQDRVDFVWFREMDAAWHRGDAGGPAQRLSLEMDTNPAESVSLHVFRRQPLRRTLIAFDVDVAAIPDVEPPVQNPALLGPELLAFYRERRGCPGVAPP